MFDYNIQTSAMITKINLDTMQETYITSVILHDTYGKHSSEYEAKTTQEYVPLKFTDTFKQQVSTENGYQNEPTTGSFKYQIEIIYGFYANSSTLSCNVAGQVYSIPQLKTSIREVEKEVI